MDGLLSLIALGIVLILVVTPCVVFSLLGRVRSLEQRVKESETRLKRQSHELDLLHRKPTKPNPENSGQDLAPQPVQKPESKPGPAPVEKAVAVSHGSQPPPVPKRVVKEQRVSEPISAVPPRAPMEPTVVPWLKKMGLVPPQSGDEGANPMGWWSTRIGLVFGVIAAVFLGMYVNQNTVPWVRLLELVLVAVGVFGLGCWFEKKLQNFGRALTAGGLSLLFVAAYAAYGLPAMKVIQTPFMGALAQIAALALTASWSLWRGREPVFGLALVLGYVTSWFSASEGLAPVALMSLLVLSAAGSLLYALRGWCVGVWAAILGSGLGLCALAFNNWTTQIGHSYVVTLASALAVGVFPLLAISRQWQSGHEKAKALVPFATSLSLLAGAIATISRGFDLEPFYASFAILFLLFGWWWRRHDGEGLWQTLLIKASVLIAMLIIVRFDGPVRSYSLLAQAGGLLFLARNGKRVVFEVAAGLAALVGWIYLSDSFAMRPVDGWDSSDYYGFGYLLVVQVLVLTYRFLLGEGDGRRLAAGFCTVFVTGLFVVTANYQVDLTWGILLPLGFGVLCLVQYWPLNQKDPAIAPFTILVGTLFVLMDLWAREISIGWQSLVWASLAWGFYVLFQKRETAMEKSASALALWLSIVGVYFAGQKLVGEEWLPVVGLSTALIWALVGRGRKDRFLRDSAVLPGTLGAIYFLQTHDRYEEFAIGIWALVVGIAWWAVSYRKGLSSKRESTLSFFPTFSLGFVLMRIMFNEFQGDLFIVSTMLLSTLILIAWRYFKDDTLSWLSLVFSALALSRIVFNEGSEIIAPGVVALVVILAAAQGIWLARSQRKNLLAQPRLASILWGGAAMLTALIGLGAEAQVASWTTAGWALSAVSLLVSGFWAGLRGYRIIGLIGIGVTIIRLFGVDIQDSFWRIIAFGVTGALLIGIGYLYNRFHRRLAKNDLDWGLKREPSA